MTKEFNPHHINAHSDDLRGNGDIGRYVFIPGSNGRAKHIAEHFENVVVKEHSRGHHLYLGTLKVSDKSIDVASVSSGMGCPSMEIILHELFHLGAKRFLRVGTAGSLQPTLTPNGTLINAQAAVRDEQTTTDYVPLEVPAIASLEFNLAIQEAAQKLNLENKLQTGIVHCKSSFYAREFGAGPSTQTNMAYLNLLTQCGVLATEMESSALFIQTQLYNHQLSQLGKGPSYRTICGAILGILATPPHHFVTPAEEKPIIENLINLALESVKTLAMHELSLAKQELVPECV